jgi:hypothetical protein
MRGIERTLEEGKMGASKIEGSMQMLDQRLSKEEEGHRKDSAEVKALTGRVNELCKGKEDKERQDRQYMDERLEKAMADKERLSAVEGALKALEMLVEGKEADVRQARERAQEEERTAEVDENRWITAGEREERERTLAEKISRVEEGLERERSGRMRLEEERRKEKEAKERMESIKKMESKVNDACENLKILNLRFKKVSDVKVELLKEAEER